MRPVFYFLSLKFSIYCAVRVISILHCKFGVFFPIYSPSGSFEIVIFYRLLIDCDLGASIWPMPERLKGVVNDENNAVNDDRISSAPVSKKGTGAALWCAPAEIKTWY